MGNLFKVIALCSVLLVVACGGVLGADWFWMVNSNPVTGNLHFIGQKGSASPLTLTGIIYNDASQELTFSGITLGPLPEDNPVLTLWNTDLDASMPGVFSVLPKGAQNNSLAFTLGEFDLSKAAPGLYKFNLVGSATFGEQEAGEVTSGDIVVEVQDAVPEPASLLGLGGALASLLLMRRRLIS